MYVCVCIWLSKTEKQLIFIIIIILLFLFGFLVFCCCFFFILAEIMPTSCDSSCLQEIRNHGRFCGAYQRKDALLSEISWMAKQGHSWLLVFPAVFPKNSTLCVLRVYNLRANLWKRTEEHPSVA